AIAAFEADSPGARFENAQDAAAERGLSRTALADNAQRFAATEAETYRFEGLNRLTSRSAEEAPTAGETHAEVFDIQDGVRRSTGRRIGGAMRSPLQNQHRVQEALGVRML